MNEKQIAEIMGWGAGSHEYHILETWDEQLEGNRMAVAKLLQEHMVDNKCMIKIMNNYDGEYMAEDVLSCKNSIMSGWMKSEPDALVDLFCKVNGIGDRSG